MNACSMSICMDMHVCVRVSGAFVLVTLDTLNVLSTYLLRHRFGRNIYVEFNAMCLPDAVSECFGSIFACKRRATSSVLY